MPTVNVRISSNSYQILKTLPKDEEQSMQSVMDQAIENLRRSKMLEAANTASKQSTPRIAPASSPFRFFKNNSATDTDFSDSAKRCACDAKRANVKPVNS